MKIYTISSAGGNQRDLHGGNWVNQRRHIHIAIGIASLALTLLLAFSSASWPVRAAVRLNTNVTEGYASPVEVLLSTDEARLYVLCQESDEVRVLNAASYKAIKTIPVGHIPRGFALSSSGANLYVANSWDDTISVIDTVKLAVSATWTVGAEPSSVIVDKSGDRLYVANRISNDVAVLDARTGKEEKRLDAGRGASYLALSPDGAKLYVSHVYPNPSANRTGRENRTPPESEITVIDTQQVKVIDRLPLHDIAGVFHVAISLDGRLGVAAELHPKNLIPLAHLEHGAIFADTITLFGADIGKPVEVPLDELERYASQPFGVVISTDKSKIYVTSSGSEIVSVIDVSRLIDFIHIHPEPYSEDLSAGANYVVARIPVGLNPRGVTLGDDGKRLFVANRLDDSISVIDTKANNVTATVPLTVSTKPFTTHQVSSILGVEAGSGARKVDCAQCHNDGRKQATSDAKAIAALIDAHKSHLAAVPALNGSGTVSVLRRGEQIFYTSRYSFQGQMGCANCHIDSTFDGLQWNLEPNGFGRDIVDNRPLEDLRGTEPYKWNGANPNVPTEDGPRTEKYFWRSENYDDRSLTYLAAYILNLPPRPNRFRKSNGELAPAQARGKAIFERTVDKNGKPIPEFNQCAHCHSGPKGTDQRSFDVGTTKITDNVGPFDTPQLTNIALSAPYLHDGSARTLEEIWTIYNPAEQHGRTKDLTREEIRDLVEYLKTR